MNETAPIKTPVTAASVTFSTRPVYETADNLKDELDTISECARKLGFKYHKNPVRYYQLDFSLEDEDGCLFGMAEVKRRHCTIAGKQRVILSLNKWKHAMEYVRLGMVFYFIVKFDDGIHYAIVKPGEEGQTPFINWGGRTHTTRDDGDIEPVVNIPTVKFRPLVGASF